MDLSTVGTLAQMLEHEQAALMPMPAPFDGYLEELAQRRVRRRPWHWQDPSGHDPGGRGITPAHTKRVRLYSTA